MESINKTLNNLSLYEVKAYVRKAQNAVLSLTEMEGKVREATNNEPWGAPSSLMQQIAAGTYNYREREEIINMIFKRFTEKSAHEWRQIYKALQLLEYIIKNGSERFVDDAKANISIIQMLKSFHYIDAEGRDQGINVRNRAKQLVLLLNDESLIRQERKKARLNLKKFGGVAGGKSSINPSRRFASSSSYNNYGEDDDDDDDGEDYSSPGVGFGSHQNRIFGDGGVYGERSEEEGFANRNSEQFDEYEVSSAKRSVSNSIKVSSRSASTNKPVEVDLFSLDEPLITGQKKSTAGDDDDDDDDEFDDFQVAVPEVQSTPAHTTLTADTLADLFNSPAPSVTTNMTPIMNNFNTISNNNNFNNMNGLNTLNNNNNFSTMNNLNMGNNSNRMNLLQQQQSNGAMGGPMLAQLSYNQTKNSNSTPAAKKEDVFSSLFVVAAERTKKEKS